MKYLIHCYSKRLWYVEQYLIPSMVEQGIVEANIGIYNDDKGDGNLKSFLNSCLTVDDNEESTWHLQDDVCICKDFRERTEEYSNGLVAGFCSFYDKEKHGGPGNVTQDKMWFSFPCILIPNQYAIEGSKWITENIIGNEVYRKYWEKGVNDDWCFRQYLKACHPEATAINLAPNLVEHVDYLLGGGSGGKRNREAKALYFNDIGVVKELEGRINGKIPVLYIE